DDSWTDIILNDVYNTFYRDEEEETQVAKESEDMAHSVMKGHSFYTKLVVIDGMVDYVLEKYRNNWKCEDEITYVILEDLWLKYRKGKEAEHDHLKVNKGDKGKGKEAEHESFEGDKGKGKVHDIQNRLEKLKVDLARAIKAKQAEHDKGKGKQLDDVDLDDHDDDLDAHDDDLDALDLENRIKKLEEDFEVVQLSSDEDDSSDEGFYGDEDVVLFNDVKYPLTDAEIRMFKERPTTSRAPTFTSSRARTASTSTRSRASTTSILAPRGYRKIAVTGCVLGLRAPNDPNAPPPSATRKRKSKK
ncbi:hypothetical protein Tco_1125816, partial [Tanacetum coccineum]